MALHLKDTLFQSQRYMQVVEPYLLSQEIDMRFKPEKEIVSQMTEVLKTVIYYTSLLTKQEKFEAFYNVIRSLGFPETTWPTHQWTRMQMNYITKMKRLGRGIQFNQKLKGELSLE